MTSIQRFFPFSPEYSTWESFNGALLMIYSEEPIPYMSEIDWKATADSMAQLPTFLAYPISDSEGYATWQDWANDFTQIVNGPSQ
jgi:hypothetical protein